MYLMPTAGFQNMNFDIWKQIVEGGLYEYPIKICQGRKSSWPLWAKLKVLPGSLTALSAPQAHSRVSNINFDIWKQIVEGVSINIQ